MIIGTIGLGNMASALLTGFTGSGQVKNTDIIGADASEAMRQKAADRFGITVTDSNKEAAKTADILFLCVKPVVMPLVLEEIRDTVTEDTLLVSIAAGKTVKWIEDFFDHPVKLVRCMPNTPALVQAGMTAVCRNGNVSDEELNLVMSLLTGCGLAEVIPETLMDAVVGVSGSSPAYVFMMIEAIADAGVKGGMQRGQAYRFAAQAVMGSAKLMLETGLHPGELKDMVCSPAGTTIDAVEVLEENGFRAALMKAVDACIEKSKKL
ncbi:MAG: pyrroline-5-carboxylate reductase [Lachnospiraceae bacterium]|nr:pyrroline-5-carboxylate reductase [Lachnospiraceae bacterium]